MNRLQRAAVLVSLIESMKTHGSWCGGTHIQKACYFLQGLLHVPLGFDFILYKHGPYSFGLTDELTALRVDAILTLDVPDPQYGPRYSPGELRDWVMERFTKTVARFGNQIEFVASTLSSRGVADLERLATALYVLLQTEDGENVEEQAQRIIKLKPHISHTQAADAVEEIARIREQVKEVDGHLKGDNGHSS